MARPAGLSSDEDYSDDSFTFGDSPRAKRKPFLFAGATSTTVVLPPGRLLINAVMDNNVAEAKRLLEEGTDANYRPEGVTVWPALLYACSEARKECIELLLSYGADPNIHYELFTPIMAICNSTVSDETLLMECIDILILNGSKVDTVDWSRGNAIMYAVKRGHEKLVLKLISLGCNLNNVDTDGWSALNYAVDTGDINMVQILKDAGGNLTHIDRRGRSLYDIAIMREHKEISEIVSTKERYFELDELIERRREKEMNNYKFVISELPNKEKGRLSGFPMDALKIVSGIGLGHLTNLFFEKNVQLGEFLTWNNQQWKDLGVNMSNDRHKILYNVKKFHERHWGKLSLGAGLTKDDISLFTAAQILANIVRQLNVLSHTTFYWHVNMDKKNSTKDTELYIERGLNHLYMLEKEIVLLIGIFEKIDQTQKIIPADFIKPKRKKRNTTKYFIFTGLFLVGVLFVKRKALTGPAIFQL